MAPGVNALIPPPPSADPQVAPAVQRASPEAAPRVQAWLRSLGLADEHAVARVAAQACECALRARPEATGRALVREALRQAARIVDGWLDQLLPASLAGRQRAEAAAVLRSRIPELLRTVSDLPADPAQGHAAAAEPASLRVVPSPSRAAMPEQHIGRAIAQTVPEPPTPEAVSELLAAPPSQATD